MSDGSERASQAVESRRVERATAAALIALIPAVMTYALVHLHLGNELNEFVPHVWNDQVAYWHKIGSFGEQGLNSGYYTPDEQLANLSGINHFGTNGPGFPIAYGVIAWIGGWGLTTSMFVNMAALGLALAAFVWVGRLDRLQIALVALIAVFLGPLVLYVPTASQETLNQVIAVVLAVFFSALLVKGPRVSTEIRLAGLTFIVLASFLRFSWALLLLPAILLAYPPRSRRLLLGELALVAAVTGSILLFLAAMNPPGQNSVLDTLGALPSDPLGTISTVASDVWENLRLFIDPEAIDAKFLPSFFDAVSLQAWQIAILLLLAIGVASGLITRLRGVVDSPRDELARKEWLFHAYNLGSILIASLMLYLPVGYYRVLGAHLLLSLLVMVRFHRVPPVALVIVSSAVMMPSFLKVYEVWTPNFALYDAGLGPLIDADREKLARHVRYQDDASTPWCNTLLIGLHQYDYRVTTTIPTGIGVSSLNGRAVDGETLDTIEQPLKSHYVILDEQDRAEGNPKRLSLEPVTKLELTGTLYTNPAAPCGRRSD